MTSIRARVLLLSPLLAALIFIVTACSGNQGTAASRISSPPALRPTKGTANLTIESGDPGSYLRGGAVGLSVETIELSRGRLTADDASLVSLMRLLGPSVLRIGGSSVDFTWWGNEGETPPSWATGTIGIEEFQGLRNLLNAAGWRVILGVDLGHYDTRRLADEVRAAKRILGSRLVGIEIGNEPNAYSDVDRKVVLRPPTYDIPQYLRQVHGYRRVIHRIVPRVAIDGPALSETAWLTRIGRAARVFTELTQHHYPTSTCPDAPATEPSSTVQGLLSVTTRIQETQILDVLRSAAALTGRPTRIDETNSVACGGESAASPALASALWALDWSLRATSTGVRGINFHDALSACGEISESPICAPSFAAASRGTVTAQPEFYGMLAARRLEGGRFVPVRISSHLRRSELTAWATQTDRGTIKLAIDNLSTTGAPERVRIRMPGYACSEELLVGPSASARRGISLGGVAIDDEGRWQPSPSRIEPVRGYFRVTVDPASASILTLTPEGKTSRHRPPSR